MTLDHQHIATIIETAWNHKDSALLSEILADTLDWYEDTFDDPITNKQSVLERWDIDLQKQSNIQARVTLLDAVGDHSYHRCTATWNDDTNKLHDIDAIFLITLNSTGRIVSFLPWYANRS